MIDSHYLKSTSSALALHTNQLPNIDLVACSWVERCVLTRHDFYNFPAITVSDAEQHTAALTRILLLSVLPYELKLLPCNVQCHLKLQLLSAQQTIIR